MPELLGKGDAQWLADRKDGLKDDFSVGMIRAGLGMTSKATANDKKQDKKEVDATEAQIAGDAKKL